LSSAKFGFFVWEMAYHLPTTHGQCGLREPIMEAQDFFSTSKAHHSES